MKALFMVALMMVRHFLYQANDAEPVPRKVARKRWQHRQLHLASLQIEASN